MNEITVVTSITGGKDRLRDDQTIGNAKYVAFLDTPQESKVWEIRPAYDKFKDPRRNSRIHKILIHKYIESKYTIWIDGNIRLLVPPEEIIDKYMKGYDMAVFHHPNRDCVYDEIIRCCKWKLDDIELFIEQAKWYENHEYGKKKGLYEGGVLIRKNTEKVRRLNEAWWADYCRFTRRDQISLAPAIDEIGINLNVISEEYRLEEINGLLCLRRGDFDKIPHAHFEGNFNGPQNTTEESQDKL